jgi:hypothetical protein
LQFPDFFFDGAGSDQPVSVYSTGLADAMGAVDGLRFDGGIPPWIVENDIAGGGEVESSASRTQAEEEDGGVWIFLKGLDDRLPLLRFAREDVGWNLALAAFGLQNLEHLDELAEDEDLLSFSQQWLQQFEQRLGLAGRTVVAYQFRMAADLAQARETSEDVNLAFVESLFGHRLQDLLAGAAQLGQIKLSLRLA